MRQSSRLPTLALVAGLLAASAQSAFAARVLVDFDGDAFATSGEIFLSGDTQFGTGRGAVPFQLNFGSGAASYDFCFAADGFVQFVATGGACSATPTGDYIAPFLADLTVGGNTLWSTGLVDSTAPFVVAEATPALRFIWDATDSLGNSVLAGLVLLDQGAGNFDLKLEYGNDLFGIDGAPDTGKQGLSLGTNVLALTSGPFATATDYRFSFIDGTCTSGCGAIPPPTTVPEPPMVLLAAAGLAGIALGAVPRRRRAPARNRPTA
jgi:hypothetical protein